MSYHTSMSLTNDDLNSIKSIVNTAVSESADNLEFRLRGVIKTEIQASERRLTSKIFAYTDARFEQLSIQMEAGFTHLQSQIRKSLHS